MLPTGQGKLLSGSIDQGGEEEAEQWVPPLEGLVPICTMSVATPQLAERNTGCNIPFQKVRENLDLHRLVDRDHEDREGNGSASVGEWTCDQESAVDCVEERTAAPSADGGLWGAVAGRPVSPKASSVYSAGAGSIRAANSRRGDTASLANFSSNSSHYHPHHHHSQQRFARGPATTYSAGFIPLSTPSSRAEWFSSRSPQSVHRVGLGHSLSLENLQYIGKAEEMTDTMNNAQLLSLHQHSYPPPHYYYLASARGGFTASDAGGGPPPHANVVDANAKANSLVGADAASGSSIFSQSVPAFAKHSSSKLEGSQRGGNGIRSIREHFAHLADRQAGRRLANRSLGKQTGALSVMDKARGPDVVRAPDSDPTPNRNSAAADVCGRRCPARALAFVLFLFKSAHVLSSWYSYAFPIHSGRCVYEYHDYHLRPVMPTMILPAYITAI
eukprot:GHVU01025601.1.p1 GENE.GHVU01025601.1~~GHVU01025601.1.p1  ORF type:complete len:444 (+),score=33.84 GHVU01025601.1:206-1537(+)